MTRRELQESCVTHMAKKLDETATVVELLRLQVENSNNEISRLREETRRIHDLYSNRSNSPTRSIWKLSHNMRISSDQPSVYEIMDSGRFSWAFAQLSDPLTSFFAIRILSIAEGGYVMIGLTTNEHLVDELPGRKVGSIGYYNRGEVVVNGNAQIGLQSWKNGDTIECRVLRTSRFIVPESEEIFVVQFSLNGAIVSRKSMTQLREGLFPTIRMGTFTDSSPKIEYLQN